MLTQLVKSINWVDVTLIALFVWVIFNSVKSGLIPELFKILATIMAVFVSLHYFSFLAAVTAKSVHVSIEILEFVIFLALWGAVILVMKFVRDSLMMLFKAQTTNQGVDQYGAGIIAVVRGLLISSLTLFAILLMRHEGLAKMALKSWSYKIAGKAATGTYGFLQNQIVGKLLPKEKYNDAVNVIIRGKS